MTSTTNDRCLSSLALNIGWLAAALFLVYCQPNGARPPTDPPGDDAGELDGGSPTPDPRAPLSDASDDTTTTGDAGGPPQWPNPQAESPDAGDGSDAAQEPDAGDAARDPDAPQPNVEPESPGDPCLGRGVSGRNAGPNAQPNLCYCALRDEDEDRHDGFGYIEATRVSCVFPGSEEDYDQEGGDSFLGCDGRGISHRVDDKTGFRYCYCGDNDPPSAQDGWGWISAWDVTCVVPRGPEDLESRP